MSNVFFVGESGIDIELALIKPDGTPFDISGTTSKSIIFVKPVSIAENEVAGSFTTDGKDGKLFYTIPPGFFDTAGRWTIHAHVVSASYNRKSGLVYFDLINAP